MRVREAGLQARLTGMGVAWLLIAAVACVGTRAASAAPAMFVIDSSNRIDALDGGGALLQKVDVAKDKATLNGGITVAMDHLYVTYFHVGDTGLSSGVYAFRLDTLQPAMLHMGAFKVPTEVGDPGILRGIAYDPASQQFHVASERLGLLVFDRMAQFVSHPTGAPPSASAIAYDAADRSVWVANDRRGVAEYRDDYAVPIADISPTRGGHARDRGAVAVAVAACEPTSAVVVAFAKLNTSAGHLNGGVGGVAGAARAYDADGRPVGAPLAGKIVNPHGIACTAQGDILIAADTGLSAYSPQGMPRQPALNLPPLAAPILGVFAVH